MKPRLFDGEHLPLADVTETAWEAAMKPRLFDGEHNATGLRQMTILVPQ